MVNYRPMGKTELEVSEIGFGVWTLVSGRWGAFTEDQAIDLLRKAYDAGINYYDVSPLDGGGLGERALGKAFADRRELVILSTKVGLADGRKDFTPAGVRASVDQSLARLGTPYIDALQLHYPDAGAVANPALWSALEDLRSEGKIRYYGMALGPGPVALAEARVAMRKYDLALIQVYYNLLEQEPGRTFFPVALEIKQSMTIRAPHAGGALEADPAAATGFPCDGDLQIKEPAWLGTASKRASNLAWIHESKGMTMEQAALKFILSEETVASVIPNIYREDQLATFTAVSDFDNFSQSELGEIAEQFRRGFGVP